MILQIYDTVDEVLTGLANYFVDRAAQAIAERDRFAVSLSGGSSPKKLYSLLASEPYRSMVQWEKIAFFFGDERYVPADNPASNYLMVKEVLFEPLAIGGSQVYAVNTMLPPVEAADQYWNDIRNYFAEMEPRFDLVLLGLGDDAHTASLFPNTSVLSEKEPAIRSVYVPGQQVYRITFTAPLINMAHNVAFLVYGESKAQAVYAVLEEDRNTDNFPAQMIGPSAHEPVWFMDVAAARKIKQL